ncbi:hypothetical protein N2W54_002582 [Lotmaria passim]
MPKPDPSDENSVLIKKLKHACETYGTASKKYLAAVKELDSAMENIAIAIRELAQGEEDPALRDKADHLCSSVDRHMASGQGGASKSRRTSGVQDGVGAGDPDNYTFVAYMNDFSREITVAIEELKESLKAAEKAKSAHDDMESKYNKKRTAVSDMETKLAKKNQGITDNPKFAKKVTERDAAKASLDTETKKYNGVYAALLEKRSQTLKRVVEGLNKYAAKYYDSLAKTIST